MHSQHTWFSSVLSEILEKSPKGQECIPVTEHCVTCTGFGVGPPAPERKRQKSKRNFLKTHTHILRGKIQLIRSKQYLFFYYKILIYILTFQYIVNEHCYAYAGVPLVWKCVQSLMKRNTVFLQHTRQQDWDQTPSTNGLHCSSMESTVLGSIQKHKRTLPGSALHLFLSEMPSVSCQNNKTTLWYFIYALIQ